MPETRRNFLKKAGLVAGVAGLSPGAASAFGRLDLVPDETDFWGWVRNQYSHVPGMINLNNGAVSPSPKPVTEMYFDLIKLYNQAPSYHSWREKHEGRYLLVKKLLAEMLNCSTAEIAVNRNATESLDTVIFGLRLEKGDEVILSRYDYSRMLAAWKYREKRDGIALKWVDFDFPENDPVKLAEKYTSLFTPKTKLVHLTHMINWSGQMLPAKEITAAAHAAGIPVLLDAAHTFAHIRTDMADIGCDYMGASLHKWLCAPMGNGVLYVKKDMAGTIEPMFPGRKVETENGSDIGKFEELGTMNAPGQFAVSAAIDFHNLIGMERKEERLRYLKNYWTSRVKDHPRVRLWTPGSPELSGTIGLVSVEGATAQDLQRYLFATYNIHSVSIVFEKLNAVRISPNVYTSLKELDVLVEGLLAFAGK